MQPSNPDIVASSRASQHSLDPVAALERQDCITSFSGTRISIAPICAIIFIFGTIQSLAAPCLRTAHPTKIELIGQPTSYTSWRPKETL